MTDLESTLLNINAKISSLNSRVDVQLEIDEVEPLTDTLRGSLRSCIRMIGDTLNDIETRLDETEKVIDWNKKKKRLIRKRKQLEVMLQASGKLDIRNARREIQEADEDSWPSDSGKLSGHKRERDSHATASNLFGESESNKKRSISDRDKPGKGSLWDLQFGSAHDLLAKLDEESSDESSSYSSSTDELEKALLAQDDLLSLLGDDSTEEDSTGSSDYTSSSLDELAALLASAPKKATTKPAMPSGGGSSFDLFRFGSGGASGRGSGKVKYTAPKPETIDESGLTFSYGNSEDTNIEGYRRKKKKGRSFQFSEGKNEYEMQDAHYVKNEFMKNVNLYCVFDGHSKADCSKRLTEVFPERMEEWLNREGLSDDLTDIWTPLFLQVDEDINMYEESGATGTAILVWEFEGKKYLQGANVGDSFGFLYRGGAPVDLTVPHKLSNPDERQRLIDHGEDISPNQTRLCGLNVCRVFGDHFGKSVDCGLIAEPHVSPCFELSESDTHLILASDGLWDVIEEEEAYTIISDIEDSQEASHTLMKTALRNPECQDNITVIVVKLN